MEKYTDTTEYFKWSEILSKLINEFTTRQITEFEREHFDSDYKKGEYFTLNLYYHGPRKKDCINDPEENERAETVFHQSKLNKTERDNMNILHRIWDIVGEYTNDIESVYIQR